MVDARPDSDPSTDEKNSINQIREILFGVYAQDWESKIKSLENKMQFLDGKLTELTERLDSAMLLLQAKIEKSENERQRCNESLQKELKEQIAELIVCKTDRQQLSQALRHLAEHIETDSAR